MSQILQDYRDAVDDLSQRLFKAQCTVIAKFSGDILQEQRKLYAEINNIRDYCRLSPLPEPEWWLDLEYMSAP